MALRRAARSLVVGASLLCGSGVQIAEAFWPQPYPTVSSVRDWYGDVRLTTHKHRLEERKKHLEASVVRLRREIAAYNGDVERHYWYSAAREPANAELYLCDPLSGSCGDNPFCGSIATDGFLPDGSYVDNAGNVYPPQMPGGHGYNGTEAPNAGVYQGGSPNTGTYGDGTNYDPGRWRGSTLPMLPRNVPHSRWLPHMEPTLAPQLDRNDPRLPRERSLIFPNQGGPNSGSSVGGSQ